MKVVGVRTCLTTSSVLHQSEIKHLLGVDLPALRVHSLDLLKDNKNNNLYLSIHHELQYI